MDLTNKVIVIVGGTSGLGLSAARACVRAGGRVVVIGRGAENARLAVAELGSQARHLTADAANPATAPQAIDLALREFQSFDALYHVAGGSGRRHGDGPLHEITDQGWEKTIHWNLTSMFYSNRAAIHSFLARKVAGSILNMGSVLGFSPSPKYFSTHAYATAKAAIIGMTRSAAAHYASSNIRLNVLAPALVETPMSARAQQNAEVMRFIKTKQPLDGGRIGLPSDADEAAVFFLSDASKFITGQVLSIDGGWQLSDGQATHLGDPQ